MHDAVAFETHGLPTAIIISSAFVPAAIAQAEALGAPGFVPVVVPHPVQPLTTEELYGLADRVFHDVVARITAG